MNSEDKPDDAVPEKSDSTESEPTESEPTESESPGAESTKAEPTKAEPTPDLKPADPSQTNQSAFKAIIGGTGVLAVILLVVGVLFATGVVGGSDDSGELSDGQVALVSDVPDGLGDITQEDFDSSFDRIWKSGGLNEAPAEGDPQYDQVREAAISDLLDQAWLMGEAAEQGISVTDEEVEEEFATIREQEFKTDKAYEQYLEESSLTDEEVMERVKLQVLSGKIQDEVSGDGNATAQQEAMSTFVTDYETRWKARTTCAEGYITERCGNAPEPEAETAAGNESAEPAEAAEEVPTGEIDDLEAKPPVEASSDPAPEALETEDIVEGDGATAANGDQVSVQYVGALYDTGEEFDSSWSRNNEPFEFELGSGSVIKGWDQGLVGMKEGGRRKLTIPADLAYGAAGSPPSIPGGATLVFIVDLESVN